MNIPIILAHGALGAFDDVIMLGVAIVFLVMMGVSWIKSRTMEPVFGEDEKSNEDKQNTSASESNNDRFPLA